MAVSETVAGASAAAPPVPITARALVEWTYAVQRAQGVPKLSLEPRGRSQTAIVVDRMIEFAQLGCTVDVSSNAAAIWGEARCDEDAMTVHAVVRGMPVERRALLIQHGLLRSTPDWNPLILPLRCLPVPGRKGAYKGIYARESNNRPIGTVVTYAGDWPDRETAALARALWPEGEPHLRCAEEVIEHARSVYLEWIMGLMTVEDWLDGESQYYQLRRHVVRGLGAPTHPGSD
jgi:hypothetical protein